MIYTVSQPPNGFPAVRSSGSVIDLLGLHMVYPADPVREWLFMVMRDIQLAFGQDAVVCSALRSEMPEISGGRFVLASRPLTLMLIQQNGSMSALHRTSEESHTLHSCVP
jgi:hypothetical protein